MVDDSIRERFKRDGYVVMDRLLSDSDLARARELFDRHLADHQIPLRPGGFSFNPITQAGYREAAELCADSPIVNTARELLRPDLTLTSMPFLQMLLSIPGHGRRIDTLPPHIDGIGPDTSQAPQPFSLQAGIFLSDFPVSSGNLVVWPGSHRTLAELFAREGIGTARCRRDDGIGMYPAGVELGEAVAVTGRAGSVVFVHYLLAHSSGPNTVGPTKKIYYRMETETLATDRDIVLTDPFHEFA